MFLLLFGFFFPLQRTSGSRRVGIVAPKHFENVPRTGMEGGGRGTFERNVEVYPNYLITATLQVGAGLLGMNLLWVRGLQQG